MSDTLKRLRALHEAWATAPRASFSEDIRRAIRRDELVAALLSAAPALLAVAEAAERYVETDRPRLEYDRLEVAVDALAEWKP